MSRAQTFRRGPSGPIPPSGWCASWRPCAPTPTTGCASPRSHARPAVSQATCHAILASLTDAGYVAREEATKAYSLGPALVPLAAGASRTLRVGRVIRPALDELATRIGLACSVAEGVGDAITLVAVAAPSGVDPLFRVGTSVPFAPPFGAIHVAWSERRCNRRLDCARDEPGAHACSPARRRERSPAVPGRGRAVHACEGGCARGLGGAGER